MAHRGPDGEGWWQNEEKDILLGHRRLSVIDLSEAGNQPMHYLDRYLIIHNGEIYNYLEIRDVLRKKGYVFSSETDTEVIAAAFDLYGGKCVEQFDGMFSFAIWDKKEKQFFAARDRLGEKPFFYTLNRGCLVFASEIKALWAAGTERVVNKKMLFNYLTIGYVDNPAQPEETFFENIIKLPAASTLIYDTINAELIIEKYWSVDPEYQVRDPVKEKVAEEFEHLFTSSLSRRLRSDVPVGTSLSGGLDSSSIVAVISGLAAPNKPHQTFSAVFPGYEKNEEKHIDIVNTYFGWKGNKTVVDENRLAELVVKVASHLDEPFGSASNIAQYIVYESARKNGYKVLLDGQGADEVLAGYSRYYKWFWQELFRKRQLYKSGELEAARKNGVKETFTYNNIIAAVFPDLASVVLEQRYLMKAIKHPDLTDEFVRLQSREAYYNKPAFSTLNDALFYSTCSHGLEELLRYADRNSMAHGLEVRLPFLNHQLIEFIFSLPATFKINDGYTKWLLRKTMDKRLPSSIAWRTDKVGFEPPQKQWMKQEGLLELITQAKKRLVSEGILKKQTLTNKPLPHDAYAAEAFDWRYLSAGFLFR